jgi:hypothetical protein
VFAVASAPRLAEITAGQDQDEARLLAVTDEIISARLQQPDPSPEAVITAWAGGLLHARQTARALGVLGLPQAADGDPDVLRTGNLERVTDPASPRLAGQVTALAVRDRQAMAAALLQEALRIAADPGCGLVERMAAAQAAHLVRGDLADRGALPGAQRELAAALDEHAAALGPAAGQWRLLLAFHVGRAGHPALAGRLLAPLLNSGEVQREDAARAVLYACAGPGADARLQNIVLEAELAALPPDAGDDRLRIHHALAANHDALGEYRHALTHGQHELALRTTIQSPDNPGALVTRGNIAYLTGRCGDAAGALRLARELLPDLERVLGPDHPDTLGTRGNIASWTGECGDPAGALRLFRELLPDHERVLGPAHPDTLTTRNNIAYWTGQAGDAAAARDQFAALLPDQERVSGPDHPTTLTARDNIGGWARMLAEKGGQ